MLPVRSATSTPPKPAQTMSSPGIANGIACPSKAAPIVPSLNLEVIVNGPGIRSGGIATREKSSPVYRRGAFGPGFDTLKRVAEF
jgi:hypothetical protein